MLLDYLTVWDLMNLRLVCRATKCWVETSDALQQMVVQVKERGFLMKLVKSGVNWSNLSVICDASDLSNSWINSKDYLRTFAKLSTSLRVLSLDEHRLPIRNGLEMILAKCTTLEKLKIGTLDLKNTTPTALATAEEMVRSLGCLKELRVTYLAWDTEQDLHGFSALLEGCVNLKLLKMPYILTASLYSMYPSSDDDVEMDQKLSRLVETVLFQPTVTHLLQRSRDRSCLKYLDVDNFDLDNLLETIVPACQKCGCLLLNVQELLEQPLPCTQKGLLADTIGSLRSCTSNLDLTSLAKLKRVHFTADSEGLSADIDKKHDQAVLTSLQSITLTLTSNPILASARLASCFLHQRRETVEKVSLGFDKLSGAAQASVFKVVTFSSCFPHLRHLTLDGYDGKTENYLLLWKNFLLLQRLKLHNCTTLDDFAFVGKDESKPAFLQLTRESPSMT